MMLSVAEAPQSEALGEASLWTIAALVIVIAAIAFLGMLWLNRRQKGFPEMFTGSNAPVEFLRIR